MTFPESERYVFEENPLEEVICQLRFPAILQIATKTPADFQDRIRDGYPLYTREEAQVLADIASVLGPTQTPPLAEAVTHRFNADDNRQQLALAVNFLAVTDLDYVHWTDFRARIAAAVAALQGAYSPGFYSRIGLRYRDVIDRQELGLANVDWSELLIPEFAGTLGTNAALRPNVSGFRTETLIIVEPPDGGSVRIQCGLGRRGEGPDGHDVFIFDADFFTETRSNHDDLLKTLDQFNSEAGNLFRWAITDRLRDALGRAPTG